MKRPKIALYKHLVRISFVIQIFWWIFAQKQGNSLSNFPQYYYFLVKSKITRWQKCSVITKHYYYYYWYLYFVFFSEPFALQELDEKRVLDALEPFSSKILSERRQKSRISRNSCSNSAEISAGNHSTELDEKSPIYSIFWNFVRIESKKWKFQSF